MNKSCSAEPTRQVERDGRVVTLLPRSAYESAYVPATGVLGFAFDSQRGTHAFASDRKTPFHAVPNTLSWVPPGCEVWSESATGGEYLTINRVVDTAHDRLHACPSMQQRLNGRQSAMASQVAHRIRAAILQGLVDHELMLNAILALERCATAALDCSAPALCTSKEAPTSGDNEAESGAARWLTALRLKRIDDYIDAHLANPPSVAELAATCELSEGFLSRVLKAATGRSPHAYQLDRRLLHARRKLVGSNASVLEIALECGFASHAHLTTTLRARLGVTPSTLRDRYKYECR